MSKSLKISGEEVLLVYKKLPKDQAGQYEDGVIQMCTSLKSKDHDETLVHEIVHAVESLSSLRHTNISPDTWEIIAGEIGRAIADNFVLHKRK
jgi:hypothetical protein